MTATLTTTDDGTTQREYRDPRKLLDAVGPGIWDREVALLVRDWPYDRVMAERMLGQAVAYLITAMETYDQDLGIGCGYVVDIAVHALILDTKNYRDFCRLYFGGRFLDHIPEIERKYDGSVEKTAHVVAENGFLVDWPLWEADFAKCTPCHEHDSAKCH